MFSRLLSSGVFARPHPAHLLLLQLEDLLLHFGDLPVHAVHALDELLLGQLGGRRVLVLPQVGRMPAWGRGLHFDAVLGLLNHSQPKASTTSRQMKMTSIKQQHHDGSTAGGGAAPHLLHLHVGPEAVLDRVGQGHYDAPGGGRGAGDVGL